MIRPSSSSSSPSSPSSAILESEFGKEAQSFLNKEAKTKDWNIAAIASISLKGITSKADADSLESISLIVTDSGRQHDLLRCVLVKEKYRQKDCTVVFSTPKRPFPLLAVPAPTMANFAQNNASNFNASLSAASALYWRTECHFSSSKKSSLVCTGKAAVPDAPPPPNGDEQTVTAWTAKLTLAKDSSSSSISNISFSAHVHLRIRRLLPLPFVYELEPPQADYIALCTMVAVSHVPFLNPGTTATAKKASISVTRQRAKSRHHQRQNHHHEDPNDDVFNNFSDIEGDYDEENDLSIVQEMEGTVQDSPNSKKKMFNKKNRSNTNDKKEVVGVWGGNRGRWVYSYSNEDDVEDILRFSIHQKQHEHDEHDDAEEEEELAIGKMTLGELATDVQHREKQTCAAFVAFQEEQEIVEEQVNHDEELIKKAGLPTPRRKVKTATNGVYSPRDDEYENEQNQTRPPIPELLLVVRNGALWPPLLLASEKELQMLEQNQQQEIESRAKGRELDNLRQLAQNIEELHDEQERRREEDAAIEWEKERRRKSSNNNSNNNQAGSSPNTPPRPIPPPPPPPTSSSSNKKINNNNNNNYGNDEASPTPHARGDPPPKPSSSGLAAAGAGGGDSASKPPPPPPKRASPPHSNKKQNHANHFGGEANADGEDGTNPDRLLSDGMSIDAAATPKANNNSMSGIAKKVGFTPPPPPPPRRNSGAAAVASGDANTPTPQSRNQQPPPPEPLRPGDGKKLYQPHEGEGKNKDDEVVAAIVKENGEQEPQPPVLKTVNPTGAKKKKDQKPKSMLEYLCGCCVASRNSNDDDES